MKKKIRDFVYSYSKNSRLKTQELGKNLKISQQSASYLISSFRQKRTILGYNTIIDPSKFGFISIIVYYNFADFSSKSIQELVTFLKKQDNIIRLESVKEGYDLACIYCVPNLSYFNKLNKDFLQKFRQQVFVADIFPIVVKHIYPKSYLITKKSIGEIVISGDRDIINLSANEEKVLQLLYRKPLSTIVEISHKLDLNSKTVLRIKKKLEQLRIIRGYSTVWDYKALQLERKLILIYSEELDFNEDKRLLEFAKVHPLIVGVTRLIGNYDMLLEIEGENLSNKDVLKELRSEFGIKRYKVMHGDRILKEKYIPEKALI